MNKHYIAIFIASLASASCKMSRTESSSTKSSNGCAQGDRDYRKSRIHELLSKAKAQATNACDKYFQAYDSCCSEEASITGANIPCAAKSLGFSPKCDHFLTQANDCKSQTPVQSAAQTTSSSTSKTSSECLQQQEDFTKCCNNLNSMGTGGFDCKTIVRGAVPACDHLLKTSDCEHDPWAAKQAVADGNGLSSAQNDDGSEIRRLQAKEAECDSANASTTTNTDASKCAQFPGSEFFSQVDGQCHCANGQIPSAEIKCPGFGDDGRKYDGANCPDGKVFQSYDGQCH